MPNPDGEVKIDLRTIMANADEKWMNIVRRVVNENAHLQAAADTLQDEVAELRAKLSALTGEDLNVSIGTSGDNN